MIRGQLINEVIMFLGEGGEGSEIDKTDPVRSSKTNSDMGGVESQKYW